MKTIFAILAVCLVASNAAVVKQPEVTYEMVDNIVNEVIHITVDTAQELQHQYQEIVQDPLHQVDDVVQGIEDRREESADCVDAEAEHIVEVVDLMHDELNVCGVVAAKTSAVIVNDVNKASQQLIFDGVDVARTYNKCRNYKNIVLKNSCYARLTIKATLYMNNARKSIRTIKKSKNERVPAVFVDSNACTHVASDKAILELDNVNASIDACVVRMKH